MSVDLAMQAVMEWDPMRLRLGGGPQRIDSPGDFLRSFLTPAKSGRRVGRRTIRGMSVTSRTSPQLPPQMRRVLLVVLLVVHLACGRLPQRDPAPARLLVSPAGQLPTDREADVR